MSLKEIINTHKKTFIELVDSTEFAANNSRIDADVWFEQVIKSLLELKRNKGTLFFIGNGASCSMASHFAVDFTKNGGLKASSLNEGTLLTCFSNDFCYENAYEEMLKRYMKDGDVLIAISSSGSSKNIVNAANLIKKNYSKSAVITLSGFREDNVLKSIGNYNLHVKKHDYGFVESVHAYYLHMLIDLFIYSQNGGDNIGR